MKDRVTLLLPSIPKESGFGHEVDNLLKAQPKRTRIHVIGPFRYSLDRGIEYLNPLNGYMGTAFIVAAEWESMEVEGY